MKTSALLATTSLLALASAQQQYTINPDSVSDSLKDFWCQQEQTQCPLICLQTTTQPPLTNDCTASSLTYACVCSDGQSPDLTEYSQTLPFFICQEWGNQCASNCNGDTGCISACRDDHPCGAQNPTRVNVTSTTSAGAGASQTAGGGSGGNGNGVYSGFAGQSDNSGSNSNSNSNGGNGDDGETTNAGAGGSDVNNGGALMQGENAAEKLGSGLGLSILIGGLALVFAVIL